MKNFSILALTALVAGVHANTNNVLTDESRVTLTKKAIIHTIATDQKHLQALLSFLQKGFEQSNAKILSLNLQATVEYLSKFSNHEQIINEFMIMQPEKCKDFANFAEAVNKTLINELLKESSLSEEAKLVALLDFEKRAQALLADKKETPCTEALNKSHQNIVEHLKTQLELLQQKNLQQAKNIEYALNSLTPQPVATSAQTPAATTQTSAPTAPTQTKTWGWSS